MMCWCQIQPNIHTSIVTVQGLDDTTAIKHSRGLPANDVTSN